MNPADSEPPAHSENTIRDVAARWVVRQDRRLTTAEAAELERWLAGDARNAAAFERSRASWLRFRQLGEVVRRPQIEARASRRRWHWAAIGGVATAAVLAVVLYGTGRDSHREEGASATHAASPAPAPVIRPLADGSVAQLRDGAEIAEAFSATERRIRLTKGVVFFTVVPDATRPFIVEVGNVTVLAVGTAFTVRFDPQTVDVLVTHGTVRVTPPAPIHPASAPKEIVPPFAMVMAGHRATVTRSPTSQSPAVLVSPVSAAEIASELALTQPMLELSGATLGELATAFAQRSGRRIEISDPALRSVRIGGRFPPDDLDGFLHALEEIYEVKQERRADGTILLRKAPQGE